MARYPIHIQSSKVAISLNIWCLLCLCFGPKRLRWYLNHWYFRDESIHKLSQGNARHEPTFQRYQLLSSPHGLFHKGWSWTACWMWSMPWKKPCTAEWLCGWWTFERYCTVGWNWNPTSQLRSNVHQRKTKIMRYIIYQLVWDSDHEQSWTAVSSCWSSWDWVTEWWIDQHWTSLQRSTLIYFNHLVAVGLIQCEDSFVLLTLFEMLVAVMIGQSSLVTFLGNRHFRWWASHCCFENFISCRIGSSRCMAESSDASQKHSTRGSNMY